MKYRIWMHSRPALGRSFYEGKVDVTADSVEDAIEGAITHSSWTHGHRDWKIERIEIK